jgi:hypothetical protein
VNLGSAWPFSLLADSATCDGLSTQSACSCTLAARVQLQFLAVSTYPWMHPRGHTEPAAGRSAPVPVVSPLRWPVSRRRFLELGASVGLALLAGIDCGGEAPRGPGGEGGERTEAEPEDGDRRKRRRGRGGELRRLLRRLI